MTTLFYFLDIRLFVGKSFTKKKSIYDKAFYFYFVFDFNETRKTILLIRT